MSLAAVFSTKRRAQILGKHGIEAEVEPGWALGRGQIPRLSTGGTRMVCLSYLDADLSPGGARFVVRRLCRCLGEIKILAGFWQSDPGQASELCAKTKADFCAARLRDALEFCLKETKAEAETLAVKLSPEREDLIERTEPSGHRPADVA